MASLAVGFALVAATVQLPAVTCIGGDTSSKKACKPGCCSNMACCETSQKRTGPPVQPLARPGLDQQNISALPASATVVLVIPPAIEPHVFSSAEGRAHSPPPLALICIRLI